MMTMAHLSMAPPRFPLVLFLFPCMFFFSTTVSGGMVGVMYRVDIPGIPPPKEVIPAMVEAGITHVRLVNGDASTIAAFVGSGIEINLSLEDAQLVSIFAEDISSAINWVNLTVSPTHPKARVTSISLGFGILINFPEYSDQLVPALRNLNYACGNLSLAGIAVSTAHAFRILTTPFPPSSSEFNASLVIPYVKPLLDYYNETGAPFQINIFPFDLYRSKAISGISTRFVMFEADEENDYLLDPVTKLSYSDLYSMMIDSALAALAKLNHSSLPIVAIGTGWPSGGNKVTEPEASKLFAAEYNSRLIYQLSMNMGTPLRRGYTPVTYIYALFDEPIIKGVESYQNNWGIWNSDLTAKYGLEFNPNKMENGGGRSDMGGIIWVPLLLLISWLWES